MYNSLLLLGKIFSFPHSRSDPGHPLLSLCLGDPVLFPPQDPAGSQGLASPPAVSLERRGRGGPMTGPCGHGPDDSLLLTGALMEGMQVL